MFIGQYVLEVLLIVMKYVPIESTRERGEKSAHAKKVYKLQFCHSHQSWSSDEDLTFSTICLNSERTRVLQNAISRKETAFDPEVNVGTNI